MRGLAITIEDHKTRRLCLDILPTYDIALGTRERTLEITRECIVRRRQAPTGQSARGHWRQMPLPGCIGRGSDREIREIGCTCQNVQGHLALLKATLQIVHYQRGLIHVLDVEPGLRPHYLEA